MLCETLKHGWAEFLEDDVKSLSRGQVSALDEQILLTRQRVRKRNYNLFSKSMFKWGLVKIIIT